MSKLRLLSVLVALFSSLPLVGVASSLGASARTDNIISRHVSVDGGCRRL